ncbi:MAG: hypothetical protein EPN38_04120 [Rhodanobacteraceae bacterium]|nr:MAG: hypothetical protein EPN38_04120 [Rhodanobacteraceae bacterium]
MNIQKSIAFAAAVLITAAGMVGIINYTNAGASPTREAIPATTDVIQTLPTLHVFPTREQLRQLHDGQANANPANPDMPYYSFANDTTGV